jgi:hypothetical protein
MMWQLWIGVKAKHLPNLFTKLLNLQNFWTYEFKKMKKNKNKKEVKE